MRFPLPADTFPTLSLSLDDKRTIEAVAEALVKSTFDKYYEHVTVHHNIVDERHWKKFKQREGMRVYKARKSSRLSKSDKTGEIEVLAPLLTVGAIPGTLDDVMYGMLSPSVEDMQLKSAYSEEGLVDWGLLSSIIKPSEQDPFRELSLKWFIKGYPLLVGAVSRTRDTFFIDSVGVMMTPNGERVGYHLYHSVDIPEIPELTGLNIVRGKISVCQLYRQRSETHVEVFSCGVYNPMGDAPPSLTNIVTAEMAVAVFKHVHCAEMKKLTRVVCAGQQQQEQMSWSRSITRSTSSFSSALSISDLRISTFPALDNSSRTCGLCYQSVGSGLSFVRSKEKHCRICAVRLCSRCRVHKTIYLPSEVEKELSSMKMAFCTRCVRAASSASSATFAVLDALVGEGNTVDYRYTNMH